MSAEAIELLRSIDATLKALVDIVQPLIMQARAAQPKVIASDRDLDGKWGDPVLKFNPRDWTGPSFKNRRLSECPPALLDMVAETFEYFARQSDANNERTDAGKRVSDYKRADAARARGWAKRIREGKHRQRHEPIAVGVTAQWAGESDGF